MMAVLIDKMKKCKPFLKWAGGKSQLIPAIEKALPRNFEKLKNLTYVEPFAGSGAVLFWILTKYPNIEKAIVNDINTDLYNAYQVIKNEPFTLIEALSSLQAEYYALAPEAERKLFFQQKRELFNSRLLNHVELTVLMIFLNKTCFNGLYRVNSKNEFNVPFGRYHKPQICDAETILTCSAALQKVTILNGDFTKTLDHVTGESFFYLDPPYRPISKSASFNAYSNGVFDDDEQRRLKSFCDLLTDNKIKWLLSNSDPKNTDPADCFFEGLYTGTSVYIDAVMARRSINSDSSKRGEIRELLISNYRKTLLGL